ncbi:MAG: hypothetical protein QM767_08460 [Anaeromyxobacter sp.]
MFPRPLALLACLFAARAALADPVSAPADRRLPIGGDWARAKGIELPKPFGVGVFLVNMRRDLEVSDVRVTLPGQGAQSISDLASFDVRNTTTLAAVKLDAWVFPVLDVYAMAGHTWTDSRLGVTVRVDRAPGEDLVLQTSREGQVGGPLLGGGATLVAGYGRWFVLADANYSWSDIDAFQGGIGALFASARTGWSGKAQGVAWRAWLGAAYLATQRTIRVEQQTDAGPVVVEIDQQPVHPVTLQVGGSLGLGEQWELLAELGTNSGQDFVGVFSAAYRF